MVDSALAYHYKTIAYDSYWYASYQRIGSAHFEQHQYDLCIGPLLESEKRGGKDDWLCEMLAIAYREEDMKAESKMYLYSIEDTAKRSSLDDELEENCVTH